MCSSLAHESRARRGSEMVRPGGGKPANDVQQKNRKKDAKPCKRMHSGRRWGEMQGAAHLVSGCSRGERSHKWFR